MQDDTRTRLIAAGAERIRRQGFNNTGIKDILDAVGVPKGSFYHYFPSKEAFGLAVVEHHMERLGARGRELLNRPELEPIERLRAFFAGLATLQAEQGYALGCPIGNLAQEMSDLSPAFRERLAVALKGFGAPVAALLTEAEAAGNLPEGLDPQETAAFIVSAWQGALVSMKVAKNASPFRAFDHMIFDRLLTRRS
jgi:TetR/AcrR family transcriptional regulator, transcriptional repressor for nem operon